MHIDDTFQNVSLDIAPGLEVRFVHRSTFSEAFVRRCDRRDADGYEMRLKSWDDSRTAREVIESNLARRVLGAYGRKGA